MTTFRLPKRLLVGNPMRSEPAARDAAAEAARTACLLFGPISSNAYATQEIILVLALGGASAVLLTPWVAVVVVSLLGLVTLSYRQTCHAYPDGGGAYAVSRANLGRDAVTGGCGRAAGRLRDDGCGVGGVQCGELRLRVPGTRSDSVGLARCSSRC